MEYASIQDLIEERKWSPGKGLSAFDSAANYMGPDQSDWVVGFTRTRDTADNDLVCEANFVALLDLLGGEDEDQGVRVSRMGHWACGWVEQIQVRVDAVAKLQILFDAVNAVADYPILDEGTHSEVETEYQDEVLKNYGDDWAELVADAIGLPLECLNRGHVDAVVSVLFSYECSYGGTEEAYLTKGELPRHSKDARYELTDMIRHDRNTVALRLMRAFGIELVRKRK